MNCKNCGAPLSETGACPYCGSRFHPADRDADMRRLAVLKQELIERQQDLAILRQIQWVKGEVYAYAYR